MEVRFDKMLREDVVFREIKRREALGHNDNDIVKKYYKAHEALYERGEDVREKSFDRLHEVFFQKFGFAKPVLSVISEFEEFENKINAVVVLKALTLDLEDASLDSDSNKIGLRVYPEHFFDHVHLEVFLRHEMKHNTQPVAYRP